jgi:hypothetical protein
MNTQHLNPTLPTPALCGAIPAKMLAHGFAAHLIQRPNRLIQLAESWFSSALMRMGNSFTASGSRRRARAPNRPAYPPPIHRHAAPQLRSG